MITFLFYLFQVLNWAISAYITLIVVWALMSWFPGAYNTGLGRLLTRIVAPYLSLFDWITLGPIGLGPMVGVLVLWGAQYGLRALLIIILRVIGVA